MAHSAIGPGLKAGGPNYVSALMNFHEDSGELVETEGVDPSGRIREEQGGVSDVDERVARLLDDLERRSTLSEMEMRRLRRAARSYAKAVDEEFAREHDSFRLVGQDNLRRYRPVGLLRIRVEAGDQPFDLFARVLAARVAGCGITVSTPGGLSAPHVAVVHDLTESWAASIEFLEESDGALAEAIRQGQTERIRYAGPNRVGAPVLAAAAETGLHLATEPVRSIGRIELLHYVREQSLCIDYHRYGNLGARTHEQRSPVD
jgi:RHH-type proline utilization regulon transcriptional repressor/proline dehydrogenase/delta 1-pyrroline-5-carboxylate dehydrogenase